MEILKLILQAAPTAQDVVGVAKGISDFGMMAIAAEVVKRLKTMDYNAQLLVTEENDISLGTRCKRANDVCKHFGASNVLLVSIHNNAKGNGSARHDRL